MNAKAIFLVEGRHFWRTKFKVWSLLLFLAATAYALFNGHSLYRKQLQELARIEQERSKSLTKVLAWFEEGTYGPEDRPWIKVSEPFWAIWFNPAYAIKTPSPLMVFSIGQAEQYGYYKRSTTWSSVYDNDLLPEFSNPETEAAGNLDFAFAVLFLMPLLLVILTFNVGGLEQDALMLPIVHAQVRNLNRWFLLRLSFYFLLVLVLVIGLVLGTSLYMGALKTHVSNIGLIMLLITLYVICWFVLCLVINRRGEGSHQNALFLVSCWLIVGVLLPGAAHLDLTLRHPGSYMTPYLDVVRQKNNAMYELPNDTLVARMRALYPELNQTMHGKGSSVNPEVVSYCFSALINASNKEAAAWVDQEAASRNAFIARSAWWNPLSFLQNRFNVLAETDYHAYARFRQNIQAMIDGQVETMILETWDGRQVDREHFIYYTNTWNDNVITH